MIYDIKNVN